MSVGSAPRPRADVAMPVPAVRVHAEVLAPVAAALVLLALTVVTWGTWGDLAHDTGYDWLAADRVAHGELPYQDFTYYYGPLGVGLLGLVFAVVGTSVAAATWFGLVFSTAAVALTYRIARRVTSPAGAAIAAVLACTAALATANKSLVQPHTVSASVAIVVCLLAIELAAAHAARPSRRRLVACAAAAGLAGLTRPEFAVAIIVALGLWLGMRTLTVPTADRGTARRELLLALAVAVGLPIACYAFLAVVAGPGDLADGLLARDELRAGAGEVLRGAAPMTVSSFVDLATDLVLYACGAAFLVALGRLAERGGWLRTAVVGLVALGMLALIALLVVRPEAVRSRLDLVYEWIPAGAALCAAWLVLRSRHERPWRGVDQVALLVTTFLAVLAAKTYGAFDPQPNDLRAQAAIYALPFAAIFLVWLHGELLPDGRRWVRVTGLAWVAALALTGVVLTAQDGDRESVIVRGPGGTIAELPAHGVPLQDLLREVEARTRPGEPVLFAPQLSALYVLADRSNPLPQLSLMPGMLATAADEDDAIARMDDVRLVAVDRRPRSEFGQGAFGETFNRRLGAWLREDFQLVATYHGVGDDAMTIDLWQRSAA